MGRGVAVSNERGAPLGQGSPGETHNLLAPVVASTARLTQRMSRASVRQRPGKAPRSRWSQAGWRSLGVSDCGTYPA